MREPGEIVAAFPRPGRALKAVLAIVAAFALLGAIVVNWAPGGMAGAAIFKLLAFEPSLAYLLHRPWTLLTSGVLTNPEGFSHALWSLLGLYFLTTDLEKRWGGPRLIRFLIAGVILGNLIVLAASLLPFGGNVFHPPIAFGPFGAITATVIAWSIENRDRQIRFMFFIPMSGRVLFWVTIGMSVLAILFAQGMPEGALAPLGGVATGLLLGGTPSPVRSLWLRIKLRLLRRGGGGGLTVESITGERHDRPRTGRRPGKGPALRVVPGGLDDDLKNRKPPKDKRYLN